MLDWDFEKKEPKKQSVEVMKQTLLGIAEDINRNAKINKNRFSGNIMTRPPRRFRNKPIMP